MPKKKKNIRKTSISKKAKTGKPPVKKRAGRNASPKKGKSKSLKSSGTSKKKPAKANKKTARRKAAVIKSKDKKRSSTTAGKKPEKLGKTDISQLKKALLQMKEEIEAELKKKKEYDAVEHDIGDPIDTASENVDKELFFEISSNELTYLNDIEAAIRKMEKGTYGTCEICRKPIPKKRLRALPYVRYCISCQSISEKSAVS